MDWRAVEHAPPRPAVTVDREARFLSEQAEIGRIVEMLLPGERLPYALAGLVPGTGRRRTRPGRTPSYGR